jgi:hypothetical protein
VADRWVEGSGRGETETSEMTLAIIQEILVAWSGVVIVLEIMSSGQILNIFWSYSQQNFLVYWLYSMIEKSQILIFKWGKCRGEGLRIRHGK